MRPIPMRPVTTTWRTFARAPSRSILLSSAEHISLQQLLQARDSSDNPGSFGNRYSLEQLKSYVLRPGDSWTEAIATHGKIVLNPDEVYVVDEMVFIKGLCYVIGNGARVVVRCRSSGPVFNVKRQGELLRVRHMGYVTFRDVNFEWEAEGRGCVFDFCTHALFHGCNFNAVRGVAIRSMCEVVVRGCNFYGCSLALWYTGHVTSAVRSTHFERCVIAIKSTGPLDIVNCSSMYCVCFALLTSGGRVEGCVVQRCLEFGQDNLVTCAGGQVSLLCSIHLVTQPRNPYPYLYRNRFQDCWVYFGYRQGACYAKQCVFAHCHLYAHGAMSEKLLLSSCHLHSVQLSRVLPECVQGQRLARCECGDNHTFCEPLVLPCDLRESDSEIRAPNQAVDTVEYDSDSEN